MKTEEKSFVFRKADVQQYVRLLGDENPIYASEEKARDFGFQTIPIPPAMPMIVYQSFKIPWTMRSPVIHRKQKCLIYKQLFINETYTGYIELSDVHVRKAYTFSKQTIYLYDGERNLCFSGTSHILSGELV